MTSINGWFDKISGGKWKDESSLFRHYRVFLHTCFFEWKLKKGRKKSVFKLDCGEKMSMAKTIVFILPSNTDLDFYFPTKVSFW